MHLLLDTQILLWAAGLPERLPKEAVKLIENPAHELLFSAASLWEITIKRGLDRSDFRVDAAVLRRGLLENGYGELAVSGKHAIAVGHLPEIHKDPFDRLLVAQAEQEGLLLVTADKTVGRYPGPIRLV
ncbi:type II toxin-antitoxin system VapC family toxin [Arhodomonas sp. SL1]|uniref:type II toxin-antitoxin system VapC family toxin n=1 Tax=Arhodomonas sp. SL1 TaxID=3425691 RepID=UPI003F8805BA